MAPSTARSVGARRRRAARATGRCGRRSTTASKRSRAAVGRRRRRRRSAAASHAPDRRRQAGVGERAPACARRRRRAPPRTVYHAAGADLQQAVVVAEADHRRRPASAASARSGTTRCSRSSAAGTSRESPSRSDVRRGSRRPNRRGRCRCVERARAVVMPVEARDLGEHVPERRTQQISGAARRRCPGSAPLHSMPAAGHLHRERHVRRRRVDAELGEQSAADRVRRRVEDEEADVDAVRPAVERQTSTVCAWPPNCSRGLEERDLGVRRQAARAPPSPAMPEPMTAMRSSRGRPRPGAPVRGRAAPGCEEECRRAPPGERGREEGGGEPPGDFSRQGRPAPRRKPVRRALGGPIPGCSRASEAAAFRVPRRTSLIMRRSGSARDVRLSDDPNLAASRRPSPSPRPTRRPEGQRLQASPCAPSALPHSRPPCSIPNSSSNSKPCAGTWTTTFPGTSSTPASSPTSRRRRSR